MTAGIITITTGVLLMNGETATANPIRTSSRRRSPDAAARPSHSPSTSTQPVRDKAPLMMNRQAMVIGALLPKTDSTSLASSWPPTSRTATATNTATSGLPHSRTKARNSPTKVRATKVAGGTARESMERSAESRNAVELNGTTIGHLRLKGE